MRRTMLIAMLLGVWAGAASGQPWLDVFAVDGADSLRVEVRELLPTDAALAVEDPGAADAPRGLLTVVERGGTGRVVPLIWDPLSGCLAAVFPTPQALPILLGATVRLGQSPVLIPGTGLQEFPSEAHDDETDQPKQTRP